MSRGKLARAAEFLGVVATSGAAIVVPLLYVPSLALPFTLPKQVVFEIAAVVGTGAYLLRLAARGSTQTHGAGTPLIAAPARPVGPPVGRLLFLAVAFLLITLAGSAVIAARAPTGAPYAFSALCRWAAVFGLACGVAATGGTFASRVGILQAVTASAAVVSAIGLLQHVELLSLPIPVISAPGSTFGNRNLGAEAVALSIPLGLGALFSARRRWERGAFVAALALECLYLAATRARGAWMGGAAGVLMVMILERRRWTRSAVIPAVAIGTLTVVVALLPGRSNPIYAADAKRLARGIDVVEASFDPDSPALRTRLGLWRRSLAMFWSAPLTGLGPGNWPVHFPRYAEPGAAADGVLSPTLSPRHAHDDFIECLTETGLLGIVALLALGAGVVVTTRRQLRLGEPPSRASTAAAAGTLVALVGAGVTGFPLEMPATLALAGLALGLIASGGGPGVVAPGRPVLGRVGAALALLLLVVSVVGAERRMRGSYWLAVAERALRGDPGLPGASRAWAALNRSEQANPGTFQVALRKAHAALRLQRMADAVEAGEAALSKEPFSPNAWAVLAEAQRGGGDPRTAEVNAERSLALLHDFPFALFVKARAADAIGDHAAALSAWARLASLAGSASADKDIVSSSQQLLRARVRVP